MTSVKEIIMGYFFHVSQWKNSYNEYMFNGDWIGKLFLTQPSYVCGTWKIKTDMVQMRHHYKWVGTNG